MPCPGGHGGSPVWPGGHPGGQPGRVLVVVDVVVPVVVGGGVGSGGFGGRQGDHRCSATACRSVASPSVAVIGTQTSCR
ncbi:hypothetical protein E1202_30435 [Saccharopolyspora karakumensis]|uniref:Uncharacterized protein n=1 Tax=Saccharopolyspora karakumensis TaxID=2530386 RepID=A0A4R5BAC5_9PSEU|nr:hypothetical protein E1202_30435 [Saccharopolyspora karakumensis]